jgi:hypothetical protein
VVVGGGEVEEVVEVGADVLAIGKGKVQTDPGAFDVAELDGSFEEVVGEASVLVGELVEPGVEGVGG